MAIEYRIIGTTDDVVTCGRCGKENLKNTIVVQLLDDGSPEDFEFWGSTCAAKYTGKPGKSLLSVARNNQMIRESRVSDARRMLAGIDLAARPSEVARAFMAKHSARFDQMADDAIRYCTAFRQAKHYREVIETDGLNTLA